MPQGPRTPDGDELCARAARLIATRGLPPGSPERSWGGPGSGEPCSLCAAPIPREELEFELEFLAHAGEASGVPTTCRFHMQCFDAWLQARKGPGPR